MKLTLMLLPATFVLAWVAIGLGFALRNAPIFTLASLAVVAVWAAGWLRRWRAVTTTLADASFVAVTALAGVGILINAPAILMLVAVVAALIAWDLTHLDQRLRGDKAAAMRVERADEIERQHVRWLLLAAGCGFGVAGLALTVRASLSFGWMFALGVLAALALSLTLRYVRQGQQQK
jgi:hypothetical protein